MTVPSNLIPFRITQLPVDPSPSVTGILMYVRDGVSYQVTADQIVSVTGVPLTRQVNAGTGLTGGGALSSNVTISVANGGIGTTQLAASGVTPGVYGSDTAIPVLTVDATGRVTAATTSPFSISGFVPTTRQVIAGTGLNGGGQLTSNVTLNANLSSATPEPVDTTGSAGVSDDISRADHKHPAIDLADDDQVDGLLGLDNGGTAKSIVPDEGAVVWSGADGLYLTDVGIPGQVLSSNGTGAPTWLTITGAGTVNSVDGSGGTTGLTLTGGPITTAGTLTLGGTLAITNGGTGLSAAATNGQLLIGNGTGYTLAGLTAGTGVLVTNATGSITIANTAPDQTVTISGAGLISVTGTYPSFTVSATEGFSGTVTSIDVSSTVSGLTFSGGPVTDSGVITMAGTLGISSGGTGASTDSGARTALGLGTIAVQDASSVSITGGNVSVGSANITTLTGTTATFTSATVTNLALTSLTLANLSVTSANITTLTGTTFGTTATTQLRGASGQITNLASTSATITTINSTSGTIVNFAATTATISSAVLVRTTTNTNSSAIATSGTISEGVGGVQYLIASQYDVGTSPNQIPLNQYLGSMAFQSSAAISVTDITMTGSLTGTIAGGTY